MIIEEFKREHLENFSIRDIDRDSFNGLLNPNHVLDIYEHYATTLAFLTPVRETICIVGICPFAKGTGEVFMLTSDLMSKYKMSCVKSIYLLCREQIFYNGYNRLQCSIRADDQRAIDFIEYIGFNRQCLAEKYIDGKDYYLYSFIGDRMAVS